MNILSTLRVLSQRWLRRGRRPGRIRTRKPSSWRPLVEALEDRSMLSSIQLLSLGDGTFQLRVEGDAKANQISIVGGGAVAQTTDPTLVVTCDQLKPMTVDHVSEVVVDTAGGADTVLLTGQWAFQGKGQTTSEGLGVRSISVNTGGGDDVVKFSDFEGQSLNGDLPGPHIEIDTGNGNDLAWFRPIFHPPTLFAGLELFVRTGGGDDGVLVENLAFAAPSTDAPAALGAVLTASPTSSHIGVDSGIGDDMVTLSNWTSGAGIIGPEVGSGGGVSLSVETGAGSDAVALTNNKFAAPVDVFLGLGAGTDTARFEDNVFGGGLVQKVIGGDGDDTVALNGNVFEPSATDNGDAPAFLIGMLLGRGNDTATLAGNTVNGVWKTQLNGDDGNDVVSFLGNNIAAAPSISEIDGFFADVDLGRGDDIATLAGNTVNGVWKTNLNGDDGNDVVSILGNSIAAVQVDVFIDLGKGGDRAAFALNAFTGSLQVIDIFGGDGNDAITVQSSSIGGVGGSIDLLVNLGGGNDTAKVEFTFVNQDPAQQKPSTVRVLGGKGDDDLALTVMADPDALAAADLLIDGGSGFDHGVGGPSVKIVNCEP